jgi:methyl-accepting chemotaxis protein
LRQGISTIATNLQAGFEKGYAKMDATLSVVEASRVLLNKTYSAVLSNGAAIEKISQIVSQCMGDLDEMQEDQADFSVRIRICRDHALS